MALALPEAVPITRRNVLVLSLTTALLSLLIRTWWPVLPLILRERGASVFDVSLAWGVFALASSLPQLLSGMLQNRYGRKPVIALPTFVAGVAYLLMAPSQPWLVMAGWLTLLNVSQGIQGQSFTVLLAESVPEGERNQAFSFFQLAIGIAAVVGPFIGGLLIGRIGSTPLIVAGGIGTLLIAATRLRYLVETKPRLRRRWNFRDVFHGRAFILLCVAAIFQLAINFSLNGPFVALFLGHERGFTSSAISFLFALGMAPGVLASLLLGRWVHRLGAPKAMGVALFGHFVLLSLLLVTGQPILIDVAFAASFLLYQAATIAYSLVQSEIGLTGDIGPMLGAIGMISGIVGAAGLPLSGVLAARFGTGSPFIIGIVLALVAFVLLMRLRPQGKPTAGIPTPEVAG